MGRKKNKLGNLRRAERKIRPFSDTKEWCGCLTPSECIALYDDGAKPTNNSMYSYERIQIIKDKGICWPRWFYFYPSKEQLKRWT